MLAVIFIWQHNWHICRNYFVLYNHITMTKIDKARKTLRDAGYFVDNLWHIDDVKLKFQVSDDEAQEILEDVLTNEWIMENIHFAIGSEAEHREFKRLADEN